ncbi:MAG: hypothetical protein J4G15_12485 [Alphaproteobacteria bacterium]|nr:hypothetical protein [Alphaproteobacteria bacterium]
MFMTRRRHLVRNPIRSRDDKHVPGAFDEEVGAADTIQDYEPRIVAFDLGRRFRRPRTTIRGTRDPSMGGPARQRSVILSPTP